MYQVILVCFFQLILSPYYTISNITAQPIWSSKQIVSGRVILKDAKQKNLWYYGPAPLRISLDKDHSPMFQLISLRYTGTNLTGDLNTKRFTNLLQFSVNMPSLTANDRDLISQVLKLPKSAVLSPLPVRHLEAVIVSGLGKTENNPNKFVKHANSEDSGIELKSGEYWSERNFSIPLDNHEAQILWDQQVNGRVAVSLNYAFYCDMYKIKEHDLAITGDSEIVENLEDLKESLSQDSTLFTDIVVADVLNIIVDINKYPNALRKIDVNENSIPAAYAALEVKCYDFSLGIRPDLAFKYVEIEGTSVTGVPIRIKTKFAQKHPDINSKHVSFPYALSMDKPLQYRIREIPYEGDPYEGSWMIKEEGAYLIDATTILGDIDFERICLDVELLTEQLIEKAIIEVEIQFFYKFEGRQSIQNLVFNLQEAVSFKNICFNFDKKNPAQYRVSKKSVNGSKNISPKFDIPIDRYILISN